METRKATRLTSRKFTLCESPNVVALLLNNHKVYSILLATNCYIDVHARIYNWRHPSTQWTKGSILKFSGPDYQTIVRCNRLLEIFAPVFSHRRPLFEPNDLNKSPEVLCINDTIRRKLQSCAQMLSVMVLNNKNKSLSQTCEYNDSLNMSKQSLQRFMVDNKEKNNHLHLSSAADKSHFQQAASTGYNRHNVNVGVPFGKVQSFQRPRTTKQTGSLPRQDSIIRPLPMNSRVTLHSVRTAVDLAKRRPTYNVSNQPLEVTQGVRYTNVADVKKISQRVPSDGSGKPKPVLLRCAGNKWTSKEQTTTPLRRSPALFVWEDQVNKSHNTLISTRQHRTESRDTNEDLLVHDHENQPIPVSGIPEITNKQPEPVDMENSLQCSLTCSQQSLPAKTEGDQQTFQLCVSSSNFSSSNGSMSLIRTTTPPGNQTLVGHPQSPNPCSASPNDLEKRFVMSIPVNKEKKNEVQLGIVMSSNDSDLDVMKQKVVSHEKSKVATGVCIKRQFSNQVSVKPSGEQNPVPPDPLQSTKPCTNGTVLKVTVLPAKDQNQRTKLSQMKNIKRSGFSPRPLNTIRINPSNEANKRQVAQKDADILLIPERASNVSSRVRNLSSASLGLNTPSKLESGLSFLPDNPTPVTPLPVATPNISPRVAIAQRANDSDLGTVSNQHTPKTRNGKPLNNGANGDLVISKKQDTNRRPSWNSSIKSRTAEVPTFLHTPTINQSKIPMPTKSTPVEQRTTNSQRVAQFTIQPKRKYSKPPTISTTLAPNQISEPLTDQHKNLTVNQQESTIRSREKIPPGKLRVRVQLRRDVPENIPPKRTNKFLLSPVLKRTQIVRPKVDALPIENEPILELPVSLHEDNIAPPPSPSLKQVSEATELLQNVGEKTATPVSFMRTVSEVKECCDVLEAPTALHATSASVSKNKVVAGTEDLSCVVKKDTSECSLSNKAATGRHSRNSQHSYVHGKTALSKVASLVDAHDHSAETSNKTRDRRSCLSVVSPSGEVSIGYSEESCSGSYGSEYDDSDSTDWISTLPWFSRFFTCVVGRWCSGDKE